MAAKKGGKVAGKAGGKRVGAGRKPKAVKYKSAKEMVDAAIEAKLPEVLRNLFALADGVTVQERNSDGTTRVYTRPPCFKSNAELMNRLLGKPKQALEHSGPDGGAIPVSVEAQILKVYGDDGRG